MKSYMIQPEKTTGGQDWVRANYPDIQAAAADLGRVFPTRHGETATITQVGVGPNGMDATPETHGVFPIG